MGKKYSDLENSELLELTDADLAGVYGGKCRDYPDDSNYYAASYNEYSPTSSGFLNVPILSQNNILNDFSIL